MTVIPTAGVFTDVATTNGVAKQAQDDMLAVLRELLGGSAETTLTISAGSVTPVSAAHAIDTEGAASSDDLTHMAITNHPDGRFMLIRAANDARTVVVNHASGGSGQITLTDSANFSLDQTNKWLLVKLSGTTWEEVFRSFGDDFLASRTFLDVQEDVIMARGEIVRGDSIGDSEALGLGAKNLLLGSDGLDALYLGGVSAKTGAYTTVQADHNKLITVSDGGGSFTVTLMSAVTVGAGHYLRFKKINSSTNFVTIDGNGSQTIDGQLTTTLVSQYDYVNLVSDGSNWLVESERRTFESVGQTITAGGALTIAHNLIVEPSELEAWLENTTSELAYAIGDRTPTWGCQSLGSGASRGLQMDVDATNINVRLGLDVNTFHVIRKNTGAQVTITNSSWDLIFKAKAR